MAGNTDLDYANSLVAAGSETQEILREVLFLPLIRYTAKLDYAPALAHDWQLLGDTGAVFHLRRDVYWQDGAHTTAYDVGFTIQRARDPATAFPNSDYFTGWRDAVIEDSFTVRVAYQSQAEPLAGLPFLPIMPKHLLDTVPAARVRQTSFNHHPVGNGPFRFVEYRPNDRWVFEANPDYPAELGGRPFLDRLVWRVIPDGTAQLTELEAGEADIVMPPAERYAALAADPRFQGIERSGRRYAFIGWNGRRPPLDDARVRRALMMAIDRKTLLDVLRDGYGVLATGPIGPYHWAYDSTLAPLPYAPDSARSLLHTAGVYDRNGNGILQTPDGRDFSIVLQFVAASSFNRDMAEMIRQNLAALGVRITTRPTEAATLYATVSSPQRDFDAVLLGWESDFRINLRNLFHSAELAGPYQLASYHNPTADSLMDLVAGIRDRAAAARLYGQLQRILRDDQPWGFLYYYPDLYVVNRRVHGVQMDVRGALVTVTKWWIPTAARRAPANHQ